MIKLHILDKKISEFKGILLSLPVVGSFLVRKK